MFFKLANRIIGFLFKLRLDIIIEIINNRYQQKKLSSIKKQLKEVGDNFNIYGSYIIMNPKYISIGNNFSSMYNLRIEAWDEYQGQKFTPNITMGDNVSIATDVHIGCINEVRIGNNVLMASRIYMSDHLHGTIDKEALRLPPLERPLFSKGPIIIEDNVWIGEGVSIMPGIRIGQNSIIAANAVVTKDVPANVVFAGVPGVVIKKIDLPGTIE